MREQSLIECLVAFTGRDDRGQLRPCQGSASPRDVPNCTKRVEEGENRMMHSEHATSNCCTLNWAQEAIASAGRHSEDEACKRPPPLNEPN